MARVNYKCPNCGKEKSISFRPGEKVDAPVCDCKTTMTRDWSNVHKGSVVDEEMIEAGQTMITSGMISGRDREIF